MLQKGFTQRQAALGYKEFFKVKLLSSDEHEEQNVEHEEVNNVEDIEKYRKRS